MDAVKLATDIVKKLVKNGYTAYFAGGWVRDYIMGHPSDDIDIATNAPPEIILELFPRTLLIGLSFGVVVVLVDGHQFEVATFRKDIDYEGGRRPSQIELATPEVDAMRRDFTINGMFYDPINKVIHDFVQGKEDIERKVLRAIGDPNVRFQEDRLRMIRALRFAARFQFSIDALTEEAIMANAHTLFPAVAIERVAQEFAKMVKFPGLKNAILEMHRLKLLQVIFPALQKTSLNEIAERVQSFDLLDSKEIDPILYILQLFPESSLDETEELCRYLKASNDDISLAKLFVSMKNSLEMEEKLSAIDWNAWALYYANQASQKCLTVMAAKNPLIDVIQIHEARKERLKVHIKRILDKSPLVNAEFLMAQGIPPGKQMGLLIKEGQRYAILEDLDSKEAVLAFLKASHLWPKE